MFAHPSTIGSAQARGIPALSPGLAEAPILCQLKILPGLANWCLFSCISKRLEGHFGGREGQSRKLGLPIVCPPILLCPSICPIHHSPSWCTHKLKPLHSLSCSSLSGHADRETPWTESPLETSSPHHWLISGFS